MNCPDVGPGSNVSAGNAAILRNVCAENRRRTDKDRDKCGQQEHGKSLHERSPPSCIEFGAYPAIVNESLTRSEFGVIRFACIPIGVSYGIIRFL
jgi:hypothetical protein